MGGITQFLMAAAGDIPGLPSGLAGLGIIALALLIGQYSTYRWVLLPERERCAKYEAEVIRLNALTMDRVVPALVTATDAILETEKRLLEQDRLDRRG